MNLLTVIDAFVVVFILKRVDLLSQVCSTLKFQKNSIIFLGVELFFVFFYFLNSLLIMLQQKNNYEYDKGDRSSDYVYVAFIIIAVASGIALFTIFLTLVGLTRNIAACLVPHLIVQVSFAISRTWKNSNFPGNFNFMFSWINCCWNHSINHKFKFLLPVIECYTI